MSREAQELAVTLAGTTSGGCVAYVGSPTNVCAVRPTWLVRLAYCDKAEANGLRCPAPGICESATSYDVRLCPAHEVLVREWVSYVESEPIGSPS